MSFKQLTTLTAILSLTAVMGCTGEREGGEGRVVEESTQVLDQEAGKIGGRTVEESETTVKVREKQQITRTLIEEEDVPTASYCEQKADINRMNEKHFTALGFDPATAKRIVDQRKKAGGFESVDQLAQIQGVDQSLFQELQPDLTASKTG